MKAERTRFTLRRAACAGLTLIALGGCAEVGPPPGGEKDVTGPRLLVSYPNDGATGVVPDSYIRLQFSETLVRPDQGSVVFISPRPSRPPEVKWKSDELLVTLPELFRSNQTYVVSVSTSVTDLRRNRLDSAITIAFSTGPTLDSGFIGGRVYTGELKPAVGWLVGLFPVATFDQYQFADSIYPDYLTTVGGDGQFSFRCLPANSFHLLAFEDKNRDELFNPAVEPFAVPDRDIVVGGDLRLDHLYLAGTSHDSTTAEVLAAVPTRDRLLRVRLSQKINPAFLAGHLDRALLVSLAEPAADTLHCAGMVEAELPTTDVVTLYFADLTDGLYRLILPYRDDLRTIVRDSLQVKLQVDDVPPTVAAFRPGEKTLFLDQIELALVFSEPMGRDALTDNSIVLWEGEMRVACRPSWLDPFRLALESDQLRAGRKYRLDVTEFDFRDMAGNALGDSLLSYDFGTLDEDSVGSITGDVLIGLPGKENQPVFLTLSEPLAKRTFTLVLPSGNTARAALPRPFELKAPPGKYLMSGFLDANGDGLPTPGEIAPLRLGETRVLPGDTIVVRARFETAGVQIVFD